MKPPLLALLGVAAAALAPASLIDAFPRWCLLARAGLAFCPGCGMTHALWWLLHGDLTRALDANARVAVVAPLLAFVLARAAWRALERNPAGWSDHAVP